AAEFQQLAARSLLRAVLRAGDAGDAGQPGQDRGPEILPPPPGEGRRGAAQALLAGGMPGTDEAAQRPLRLLRPDGARVRFGAVLVVAQQMGAAGLVPGEVLPAGVEIVLVPVGD